MTRNKWPVSATWEGEEITATYTATAERDWYGHPGVPNGEREIVSIVDVELASVEILGVDIPLDQLPPILKDVILDQSTEIDNWE